MARTKSTAHRTARDRFGSPEPGWEPDASSETRMSPWGLQEIYISRHGICNRPTYHAPWSYRGDWAGRIRGQWVSDDQGDMLFYNYTVPPDNRMVVPKRVTLDAYLNGEVIDPIHDRADTSGDAYPPPSKPAHQSATTCLLEDLPYEILRQILEYLIPTGCAYQFLQCKRGKPPAGPYQVVQQIVPVTHHQTVASAHLALAGTNKVFNAVVYDMFFGQNTFIFNVCPVNMLSRLHLTSPNRWVSWSRTISSPKPPPKRKSFKKSSSKLSATVFPFGPLGPITSRAGRHLRTVFLLISAPLSHQKPSQLKKLEASVLRAVDILTAERQPGHLIARLDIHVQAQRFVRSWADFHRLNRPWLPPDQRKWDPGFIVQVLDVGLDEVTGKVQVAIVREELEAPGRGNKIQKAVQRPLLMLRGCEEVSLSGQLTEEFVQRALKVALLDKGEEDVLVDDENDDGGDGEEGSPAEEEMDETDIEHDVEESLHPVTVDGREERGKKTSVQPVSNKRARDDRSEDADGGCEADVPTPKRPRRGRSAGLGRV
ncbi:hypothetical protein B0H63DRAFT_468260 [Podospora didyma]|uniref:Uncharacterized protein n=1 Tax=Podospora didyma TaxID=330526 RepID=A0AAE0NSA2_9PEZI|nr:hypothetical protein B0H63DRAFT_468260 [Podospora didyma]